jgi:DNA transposase THAP9
LKVEVSFLVFNPIYLQCDATMTRSNSSSYQTENLENSIVGHRKQNKIPLKRAMEVLSDSSENETNEKKIYKGKIAVLQKNVKKKSRQIANLKKRNKLGLKKVANLNAVIIELKKKNFVNEKELHILKDLTKLQKDMLINCTSGPKKNVYSPELKAFALSLNFFSPKAYDYVRKTFNSCLPHSRTLSRWYKCIDGKAGFTEEAFIALKKAVELKSLHNQKLICNLAIDEIHIRPHVEPDGETGYVYNGSSDTSDAVATKILVFLVVALNASWKIPVGYFPITSMTGEQKKNLVTRCIENIVNTGSELIGVTFNGDSSNLSMARLFGIQTEPPFESTTFKIESNNIEFFIFVDAVHCIKLVRNTLCEVKYDIIDSENGVIKWEYFQKLNELQYNKGLHLPNTHINFKLQKMKVRSSTQTLSESVADALECCKTVLKLEDFKDSGPTIKFVRMMSNIFDILNSHNINAVGHKKALCEANIDETLKFADAAVAYLSSLRFSMGQLIIESNRSTGFVGLLMNLKNIQNLYNRFIVSKKLIYLPFNKLNQDHIELFLANICSRLDQNNNPTVRQFMTAYIRSLKTCEIIENGIGNCLPLEQITSLDCSENIINMTTTKRNFIEEEQNDSENIFLDSKFLDENQYLFDFDETVLGEYNLNVIQYIAGYIISQLSKTIKCITCIELMKENDSGNPSLLNIKNKAKLTVPCAELVKICSITELEFKCAFEGNNCKTDAQKKQKIISNVMTTLIGSNSLHRFRNHIIEHDIFQNHFSLFIKCIIEKYLSLRIYYITKRNKKNSIGTLYNKLTHFKGI